MTKCLSMINKDIDITKLKKTDYYTALILKGKKYRSVGVISGYERAKEKLMESMVKHKTHGVLKRNGVTFQYFDKIPTTVL